MSRRTPRVNEENGTKNSRQRKCASDDGLTSITAKQSQVAWPLARCSESRWQGQATMVSTPKVDESANPSAYTAIDWTFQRGPFEFIGEAAWAYAKETRALQGNTMGFAPGSLLTGIEGNSGPGIPPQRMNGYYLQGNYHFMPAFLTKFSPRRFGEGSTFTAVIRYDRVNTNLDNSNGTGGWGNRGADFIWPELSPHRGYCLQNQLSVHADGALTRTPLNEFTTRLWSSQPRRISKTNTEAIPFHRRGVAVSKKEQCA